MGQKVNPHGMRVGIIKDWQSKWYSNNKDFSKFLGADLKIRKYLSKRVKDAAVSSININRDNKKTSIDMLKYNYWTQLKETIDDEYIQFNSRKPSNSNFYDISIGSPLAIISLAINVRDSKIKTHLWIDENKEFADYMTNPLWSDDDKVDVLNKSAKALGLSSDAIFQNSGSG